MDARLRDYIIRMEIFGAVEVERECLLLCEEKKTGDAAAARLFGIIKKNGFKANLILFVIFSLSVCLLNDANEIRLRREMREEERSACF
jgi:hypothetical protein